MIDPRFVYLAALLALVGAAGYVRDTLRGETAPNRVTWSLWGIEGVLAAFNEIQQHVGLAALMTMVLGLVPLVVVASSFRNPRGAWAIGAFDVGCAMISLLGLVAWFTIHQATFALVSFVAADQIAGLPTLRKAWSVPESESAGIFVLGALNCVITVMTLPRLTTAGLLFPGCIAVTDTLLAILIITRLGPKLRSRAVAASAP